MSLGIFQLPYREDKFFGFLFLLVLSVPLAFSFFLYESFEILKLSLLTLFLGFALLSWLWQKKTADEKKWHGTQDFLVLVLGFVFWGFLSGVFAWDRNMAFFGFYPRFTNGFLFLALWSILILTFGFLNSEKRKTLLKLLVVTGALVGFWGLIQSAGVGYYQGTSEEFFIRAPSFLGNPNFSTMYVSALLPLLLVYFFLAKRFFEKIFFGLGAFFAVWSVVVLTSRGAFLGMLLALIVGVALAVLKKQKKLALLFFGFLCVAYVLFSIFWNVSRPGSVGKSLKLTEYNIVQRFAVWQMAAEAIYRRPVLGAGLSNFPLVFEREKNSATVLNIGFFDDPHNLILGFASTGGVVFAGLFLAMFGSAFVFGFKDYFKNTNLETLGILAGLFAWLFASLFNPVAIPCYVLLALFFACLFGTRSLNLPNFFEFRPVKYFFSIFAVVVILSSVVFLTAEHIFNFGMKAYKVGNYTVAYKYLSLANKMNPFVMLHSLYASGASVMSGQKIENSLKLIEQTSKINPNWSITTSGLANVYYLLYQKTGDKQLVESIHEQIKKSLTLNPLSQYDNFIAAQFEYAFGNLEQAKVYSKRGVVLYGENPKFWLFLAKLYQQAGQREQMLFALEKAQSFAPENQPQLKWLWQAAKKEKDVRKFNFSVQLGLGGVD